MISIHGGITSHSFLWQSSRFTRVLGQEYSHDTRARRLIQDESSSIESVQSLDHQGPSRKSYFHILSRSQIATALWFDIATSSISSTRVLVCSLLLSQRPSSRGLKQPSQAKPSKCKCKNKFQHPPSSAVSSQTRPHVIPSHIPYSLATFYSYSPVERNGEERFLPHQSNPISPVTFPFRFVSFRDPVRLQRDFFFFQESST
ncbi:hypothetical protein HD806DRAFT_174958 [Xylariaceae sp. AK1471]|nr:hypothetical protein HD806DRAFT_174958 [Xylariaceae sp. AK1471]